MSKRPRLVQRDDASSSSLSLVARTPFSLQILEDPPYVIDVLSFSHCYAAAGSDSSIKLYDRSTLKLLRDLPSAATSNGSLKSIAKTNGGEEALIATYENGHIDIFDLRSGNGSANSQIKLKGRLQSLKFQLADKLISFSC